MMKMSQINSVVILSQSLIGLREFRDHLDEYHGTNASLDFQIEGRKRSMPVSNARARDMVEVEIKRIEDKLRDLGVDPAED